MPLILFSPRRSRPGGCCKRPCFMIIQSKYAKQTVFYQETQKQRIGDKMAKRKLGLKILAVGIVILLVALLLLFNTNSIWALVTLGASILLNAIGLTMVIAK